MVIFPLFLTLNNFCSLLYVFEICYMMILLIYLFERNFVIQRHIVIKTAVYECTKLINLVFIVNDISSDT